MDPGSIAPVDSVYVSSHADDVALSCAGRLTAEQGLGLRILIVILFGPGLDGPFDARDTGPEERARALVRLGVDHVVAGLSPASQRSQAYASYAGLTEGRESADAECLARAVELLTDVAHRTRARQFYAPLGVGGHIDRRLGHEAARAAFNPAEGRNVFLYEERPEAFVPGEVRIRLGELGARLPPAAAESADRTGLVPYLFRYHSGPAFRGDLRGLGDRLRSIKVAARHWRGGRAWNPMRAFGPRLQPVVYSTASDELARVRVLTGALGPRLEGLQARYAARLGGPPHAERYWLLLPPRAADGLETLPPEPGTTSARPDQIQPAEPSRAFQRSES